MNFVSLVFFVAIVMRRRRRDSERRLYGLTSSGNRGNANVPATSSTTVIWQV
jgi:hypothetical protein